jgi:hypothetical protein
MIETSDFFQEQIEQCRAQAAKATSKTDREFWLRLAHRWEGLLPSRHSESVGQPARKIRSAGKPRFTRNRAA